MSKCISERVEDRPQTMVEIRSEIHANLLFATLTAGKPESAIECVETNPDFNVNSLHADRSNYSNFHLAVYCKCLKLTEVLLERQPSIIDHQDDNGETALNTACR